MFPRQIVWGAFTAVLIVCLGLIMAKFLLDQAPGLFVIGVMVMATISLALTPSPRTKKAYKTMFLMTSVASAGFTIGLYSGLLESIVLLDDSYVDISRSVIVLHLKNNGLTDSTINEIKLADSSFTFKYGVFRANRLQSGEAAFFIIYYVEQSLLIDDSTPTYFSPSQYSTRLSVDPEVTPSTFQNGVSYPVVLTTNSILRYKFDIRTKHILEEKLIITASAIRYEHRVDIRIRFNNTGSYYLYLHSIEIADVLFYLEPPTKTHPDHWYKSLLQDLTLSFLDEPRISWNSGMFINKISATPEPQLSMLKTGETYEILVRTMAGNTYVTSVTI